VLPILLRIQPARNMMLHLAPPSGPMCTKTLVSTISSDMIGTSCKACVYILTLDMRHRVTTFIVKNIAAQGLAQTKKKDRTKEDAVTGEKEPKADRGNVSPADGWAVEGEECMEDASAVGIARRPQEQLPSGIAGLIIDAAIRGFLIPGLFRRLLVS